MASFPSIKPTYGSQKQSQPWMTTVQMGDGYAQVLRFGLNQNPKSWKLKWEVSDTDADTIEAFLDARAADGETFDWTAPNESTAYKWRCFKWSRGLTFFNRSSISASFVQFFEP